MSEPGLTYYDNRNKVENQLLNTQYQYEFLEPYDSGSAYVPYTKITRIRTKSYSYVGLSKSTARQCVKDKLQKYTRRYYYWTQSAGGVYDMNKVTSNSYLQLVANVNATRQDGELYTVEIQVNETCIAYVLGSNYDVDQVFNGRFTEWQGGREVPWTYDED